MSLSPLDIWLHPFRAMRELERLAAELENAGAVAEELRAALAGEKELMQAADETRMQMRKRISDLEMLAASLREQLDEARIDESQLREIEEGMTRMERGREADRRRVAQLKEELADARGEIARLSGRSKPAARKIDMTAADYPDSSDSPVPPAEEPGPQHPADDWLLPLPD